jgi:hypothetical protein
MNIEKELIFVNKKTVPRRAKRKSVRLLILACVTATTLLPASVLADTAREAVGRPLQRAEALIQAGNYHAALAQLQKASDVGSLTPFERVAIAQLHGTAEAGTGNFQQAAADYQTVLAAGSQPPAAQMAFTQAIAGFYFQAGDFPQTVTWVNRYIADGGHDARTQALLPQAYFQEGDYAAAEHAVQRAQHNGAALPQAELQLLAYSAQKIGDQPGYLSALTALLQSYPSPSTWNAAITTVAGAPDFPDALTLDVYRLRRATHTLTAAGDYEDYTERAILAGQPLEARAVIDEGFTNGILNSSTDNGHAARLKALADSNSPPAAAPGPADPLQPAIAQYQAGQAAAAATSFTHLANTPDNSAETALALLWAICAQNATRSS